MQTSGSKMKTTFVKFVAENVRKWRVTGDDADGDSDGDGDGVDGKKKEHDTLRNSLPASIFPTSYDLTLFKREVLRHFPMSFS